MFKFMMIFYQPKDIYAFEDSYNDLLALVERMPEIQRRQVSNVQGGPGGPSNYYRVLEVFFENRKAMEDALLSPAGQEAGGQMMTFPPGSFDMMFAEVFEEAGGKTPPDKTTGEDDDAGA